MQLATSPAIVYRSPSSGDTTRPVVALFGEVPITGDFVEQTIELIEAVRLFSAGKDTTGTMPLRPAGRS